jgi:hypothetical protein
MNRWGNEFEKIILKDRPIPGVSNLNWARKYHAHKLKIKVNTEAELRVFPP